MLHRWWSPTENSLKVLMTAKWERSRKRHGLWDGVNRLGYVGVTSDKPAKYRWCVDATESSGEESTLRAAKRQVEQRL